MDQNKLIKGKQKTQDKLISCVKKYTASCKYLALKKRLPPCVISFSV